MHAHPEEALAYSKLKEELAAKFSHDIDGYCNGKDLFVKDILAKAGFNELYVRKIFTDNEWFHYHRITKDEIFSRDSTIAYDKSHPSITAINNKLYVFYKGPKIIGTLMIEHHNDEVAILRIIAIDGSLQNKGYGGALIKQAEAIIKDSGYKTILLHASPKAYNFYLKCGYSKMDFSFDQSSFADSIDMGKML
jgi:N-acetylglutamate synthase-like GNAT family acetyltransferase